MSKYSNTFPSRSMLEKIEGELCVNLNSVHMTGISNGGMFNYYAAARLRLATRYLNSLDVFKRY